LADDIECPGVVVLPVDQERGAEGVDLLAMRQKPIDRGEGIVDWNR